MVFFQFAYKYMAQTFQFKIIERGKETLRERRRVGNRVRVRDGGRERGRGGVRERREDTKGG
jgi:hypothetical protein